MRQISEKHSNKLERSHPPPGHPEAVADWQHIQHMAAYQASVLLAAEDPGLAECAAIVATMAHLRAAGEALGVVPAREHERILVEEYIPVLLEGGLLVLLTAIESTSQGAVRHAAAAAVDELLEAGEVAPEWARGLRDPIAVGECLVVTNGDGNTIELICTLMQSGGTQAARLRVDEHRCGAAFNVRVGIEPRLPALLHARQRVDAHLGWTSTIRAVEPAEFRGLAEAALDARAAHDRGRSLYALHDLAFDQEFGDLEPGYLLLATLFRSRLQSFPAAAPAPPHRPTAWCPLEPSRSEVGPALA